MDNVRVRFAPSPTGYLHIGGLRTALYNYLFARQNKGNFILRIEDTDQTRFVEGAIENLINSLLWAGISYDEGVFIENGKIVEKGEFGPYIQSKRLDIYQKYVDELIEKGHAYYCFCTKERLDKVREEQKISGQIPRYDGFCRNIPLEEAKERIKKGEEYVVRLKLPLNRDINFYDMVRGHITINTSDMDDQVLLKSDGFPTYHLAVVVDDHLMGITHIVRGEEWLPSTPKHIYLYEAFGWEKPTYVHLPTVLNKDRKKLSKRQGDVSVEDFRNKGYLPEALVNYLALVGWSPEDNQEIMSLEEMVEKFSFERVSKTGGIFDIDKLNWINSHYIRTSSTERIRELAIPYLINENLIDEKFAKENEYWLDCLVDTLKENLNTIAEIPQKSMFIFAEQIDIDKDLFDQHLNNDNTPILMNAIIEEIQNIDNFNIDEAKTFMKKIQQKTGIKGKNLFMPTRVALTGSEHGPELVNILFLLGKDKIINRARNVLKIYSGII
ncbi:MAG: glutamate--tRNA ligase [Tissierellales bacterium]|nr:glutamate--tRNA ligase [Tissierellales bacterium]